MEDIDQAILIGLVAIAIAIAYHGCLTGVHRITVDEPIVIELKTGGE